MRVTGDEIVELARLREEQQSLDLLRWNKMQMVWEGRHKELFPREFPTNQSDKIAGFVRRSWRGFARNAGKVPDINVAELSLDPRDVDYSDKVERICFAYNDVWGMRYRMNEFAHFYCGFGAAGIGVMPDMNLGWPRIFIEDPRNVFPGPTWEATTTVSGENAGAAINVFRNSVADVGGGLENCIIRKVLTGAQLLSLFGRANPTLNRIPSGIDAHTHLNRVLMFFDPQDIITVLEDSGEIISVVPHRVGWCPWQMATMFGPGAGMGSSDLEQQVGLEVAFMRILNQKLALNDAVAYPWLFTRGATDVDPLKRHIEGVSPDAQAAFLTPPATFQVNQDLAMIRDLLRLFNFETEASQGDVTGGPITGRGLVELSRVTVETVQSFFDDFSFYLPRAYLTAIAMDRNLFAGYEKAISGRVGGEPFFDTYEPSKDLEPRFGRITTEFGPGLGGFEGHLQMLQSLGADSISTKRVMEKNPHIPSYAAERRQILIEKLDKLIFEQALTGQAVVPIPWLAEFRKALGDGADPGEWIVEHPPDQATATAENTAPLPPELAVALPPGAAPPGGPGLAQEALIQPPPLEALLQVG